MIRVVRIRNLSNSDVTVNPGDTRWPVRVVPAMGTLTLTNEEYVDVATRYDMSALPVSVTVPNVDMRYVSVKDFGARGDGVTDDTDAIQEAIDYVDRYGGGVVNFPIGVFLIRSIVVDGKVSLQGENKYGSVLKQIGGETSAVVSFAASDRSLAERGGGATMSKIHIVGSMNYEGGE